MNTLLRFGLSLVRAGHGRAFPILLLVLAGIGLQHLDATLLAGLRETQFDRYQRHMPRVRDNEPVIVIGIDSKSLERYGQWPWPRDLIARLVNTVHAGQALALGLDIIFAERDRYSPEVLQQRLPTLPKAMLDTLPEPDHLLAQAIAGGPTALAAAGLGSLLPGARQPAHPLPAFSHPSRIEAALPAYPGALSSRRLLENAAAGEGLINSGISELRANTQRSVLRRVPSVSLVAGQPFLSLPLEMVRLALGDGAQVSAEGTVRGMESIQIGDYRLPTLPNGEIWLHHGAANPHYYLSAADVLEGVHPSAVFQSRFVLIGFNSTGLQDRIITPLGESLPGIDIHAQVIESLLTGEALKRPWWLPYLELLALVLCGLLLIVFVPMIKPRMAALSFLAIWSSLIGMGYLAFLYGHWLFDGLTPSLLLGPVFMSLLTNSLISSDLLRRQSEQSLYQSREEAARVNGELDAAKAIQMGLLPDPKTLFADESAFSLAAILEPARAVGGDYYDCFKLDENRLCFAIGDVSGKGVPASLFMAISKTLTSTLMRRHTSLSETVRDIETELWRDNPGYQFVTALVCVLDLDSGELEYVCAGHDAPLWLRRGQLQAFDTSLNSGPPLCALGDFPYTSDRVTLLPGDTLCLFTDGASEAYNGVDMLGGKRLQQAFLASDGLDTQQTAHVLHDAVRQFEAGHPPADDLTLMVLRYYGRPAI